MKFASYSSRLQCLDRFGRTKQLLMETMKPSQGALSNFAQGSVRNRIAIRWNTDHRLLRRRRLGIAREASREWSQRGALAVALPAVHDLVYYTCLRVSFGVVAGQDMYTNVCPSLREPVEKAVEDFAMLFVL